MSTAQKLSTDPHVPAQAAQHVATTTALTAHAPAPTERLNPRAADKPNPVKHYRPIGLRAVAAAISFLPKPKKSFIA